MFRLATPSPVMPIVIMLFGEIIFFLSDKRTYIYTTKKNTFLLKQKSKLSFFTFMFQERNAIKAGIFVCEALTFCTRRAFHTWVGWFTNTTCGFFKSINKSYNRFRWPGCYLGNNCGLVEGYPIVAVLLSSYYLL